MKLAWVTPFNQRSAIGRVSASVTAALAARGHEVTIVASEYDPKAAPRLQTALPVINWRDRYPEEIEAQHDAIIVNIGDNYGFHAGVVEYVGRAQCLGIFHDVCIYHFFTGWLFQNGLSDDVRERELDLLYGKGAGAAKRRFFTGQADLAAIVENAPMTEWMSRRCGAAFAHAKFYVPRLEETCPGPVGMAYLTQSARDVPALPVREGGEVVVTTVGWINANKCADAVIEAIAGSPVLRERCRYRLVGPIPEAERARLTGVAEAHGLARLDILGEVDEATLDAELARADVLCCLRRPILEGASASAIEAMMAGRPVLVADAGFYGELPDEHVVKVPREVPVAAVRAALERLTGDEPLRRRLGEGARRWALEQFDRERYVGALERFVESFVSVKPYLAAARSVSRELVRLDLRADDPAVARIAAQMQSLFAPGDA